MMKISDIKKNADRIIWRMIQVWFGGVIFGAVLILAEYIATLIVALIGTAYITVTIHLPEYLLYIGGPVTGGIVTGLVKSALENKEKIRQNPDYLKRDIDNEHEGA